MINIDAVNHVKGLSQYVDDKPEIKGMMFALPFDAPTAHADILKIDLTKATLFPGIATILTSKDIPGENQIGGIIADEPLLADKEVHFWGQPLGLIIGNSEHACRQARKLISIDFKQKEVITCPREAFKKNHLIVPPRTFRIGNTDNVWDECKYIIDGNTKINGQEHLYIETQGAYATLKEDGRIYIASSTQGPTSVQKTVSRVLNIPMHKIEIDVVRLGGGFGGKEDQATPWAVMAALGALHTQRPVKLILHRMDDMRMTGKRHPYESDFKIGLSENLKILAYEVVHYQNAGAAADLSPAVMERTLFHSTNCYYIPNVKATAYSCKTNLPPNTAFRGFGGPQGMFVIEAAIVKAAETIGVDAALIQKNNLLFEGAEMPYGQVMENTQAIPAFERAHDTFKIENLKNSVKEFNNANVRYKKGLAIQPICFGISFTNTMMNHARALLHIYSDGSVVVSTGAVEMGQGVNTKLLQVVQECFNIPPKLIKIESTNTLRIANTSPTAASAGADLNGKALENACSAIYQRLENFAKTNLGFNKLEFRDGMAFCSQTRKKVAWQELIVSALQSRISLSEHAHYSTPEIYFDKTVEKGHPFAYHVYGVACLEVTLDCLRGTYKFDYAKIMHDFGISMNENVDFGQVEGGIVQGIGWMTMEDVLYNKEGKLMTNTLSTYKIPDIYSVPNRIEISKLDSESTELALKKSKAVGEPPFMYGIGAYFAIRAAIKAFNPSADLPINAPYTPEKVLMDLYQNK